MKTQVNVTQALLVLAGSMMITACGPGYHVPQSKMQDRNKVKEVSGASSNGGAEVSTSSFSSSSPSSSQSSELIRDRDNEIPKCAYIAAEIDRITPMIAAFYATNDANNAFWKAMAHAGGAPRDYISPHIGPGWRQGPGITDMLDGVTLLRSDLYYASDAFSIVRQALREFREPVLDPIYVGNSKVEATYRNYVAAFKAMPKFAGPAEIQSAGSPERTMDDHDARKLEELLAKLNSTTVCKE